MRIYKAVLMMMSVFNLTLFPTVTYAQKSESKKNSLQAETKAVAPDYKVILDGQGNRTLLYDNVNENLAVEIPDSTKEDLNKYSPANLNQKLKLEMSRVKSANKEAWSHSVRNIAPESAIFFVAMGAVVAGQLFTDYSQNPVAMKQHIDHQLSPIGAFGFFSFIYTSKLTTNVFELYSKNPKYKTFLPYLGMTAGFFVQSYLSQIVADPNVKACAKVMMGKSLTEKDTEAGASEDPCAEAYKHLVLHKKLYEYAPNLVSMLLSTWMAGKAQQLVMAGIYRMTGVNIALWLVPGGVQMKGIRAVQTLMKASQIAAFVAIDHAINREINYAWKNTVDGAEISLFMPKVALNINEMKKSGWNNSDKNLEETLKIFHEKANAFRMMNLSAVYEAHQNWSDNVNQLVSMYNTSYTYYNVFINELRNSRFGTTSAKLLERNYPLNGVIAKGLKEDRKDSYFSFPQMLEGSQVDTVIDAVTLAEAYLKSKNAGYLTTSSKLQLNRIIKQLKSPDTEVMAKGLDQLNKAYALELNHQNNFSYNVSAEGKPLIGDYDMAFLEILENMLKVLGSPRPALNPGQGFNSTFEAAPMFKDSIKDTSYYRRVGHFSTPYISEYLMMQMVCGPDAEANEALVKQSRGFPSVFLPPQITNAVYNSKESLDFCQSLTVHPNHSRKIYNYEFQVGGKKYKGIPTYLIKEARSSVVGSEKDFDFNAWWEKNTENQMKNAFYGFTLKYSEVIAKMLSTVYQKDSIRGNLSPLHNGTMTAIFQEERFYLLLLEELIKPSKEFKLDIKTILERPPTLKPLKDIEHEFMLLNRLIKKIKVVEKNGRQLIQSDVSNGELEEQVKNIKTVSNKLEKLIVKLNPQQLKLAKICFERLQALAFEMMNYGTIANVVSWDKIQNAEESNLETEKYEKQIKAKMKKAQGMTHMGGL